MAHFRFSILFSIACLTLAWAWGGPAGVLIAFVLALLELGISFDNALVNASVLEGMNELWRRRFLTWGILVAVFGMRLVFPLLVVAVPSGMGILETASLALNHPAEYSSHLMDVHVQISAFGGMYLLMVFLTFFFDSGKERHWLAPLERRLSAAGRLETAEVLIALFAIMALQSFFPDEAKTDVIIPGMAGLILYLMVNGLASLVEAEYSGVKTAANAGRAGAAGFVYLEVLDASFSIDGVVGAFAITKDVVIIMLGLAIGAVFVRSITIKLVDMESLGRYIYLEHGAHYAIGALAVIMLLGTRVHVPEVFTALAGIVLILLSFASSVAHRRRVEKGS